jgi:Leucine-rich repeat (LRR) protein
MSNDRFSVIKLSQWELATITSCVGKWVKIEERKHSGSYRDQLQFVPEATANSGLTVRGIIMLPTRAICNLTVGSSVSILVHPTNATENRIYSFIQFWLIPILILSLPILFLIASKSPKIGRFSSVILILGFTSAITQELGLLKGIDSPSKDKVSISASAEALDRCIYTSMKKEGVKRGEIKRLLCMDEDITEVKSLANLLQLEELYLQNNALTSFDDFPLLINLRIISVANNKQLTSTKGIEKFTALEELQANKSGLTNLSGVDKLTNLKIVGLMMNKLTDVSEFTHLKLLEDVVLSYNPISDISAFKNKKDLTRFTAHDTKITDISPLLGSKRLKIVGVSSSNFSCSQLNPFRESLPKTSKIYGPSRCNN